MYPLVQECTKLLEDAVDEIAVNSGEIDLKKTFGNLTMDVICSCAFATKINTHNDSKSPFVTNFTRLLNRTFFDKVKIVLFMIIPFLTMFRLRPFSGEAVQFFKGVIVDIIARRRKTVNNGKKATDFLQLMLDSRSKSSDVNNEADVVKNIDNAG